MMNLTECCREESYTWNEIYAMSDYTFKDGPHLIAIAGCCAVMFNFSIGTDKWVVKRTFFEE